MYNFRLHPPLAGVALAVLVVEAGPQHRQRRPAAEVLTSDQLQPGHLIMTLYVHNNPQYNDPALHLSPLLLLHQAEHLRVVLLEALLPGPQLAPGLELETKVHPKVRNHGESPY